MKLKIKEIEAKVESVKQEIHNVKLLRVKPAGKFDFKPGQFVMLKLDVNGCEEERALSIASSPDDSCLEFGKLITKSDFSKSYAKLKPGDTIKVKGPYGNMVLRNERRIVMLASGIGSCPFRSMLKHIVKHKLPVEVVLIYSCRTPEDITYRFELDKLAKLPNIKVVYTITRPWLSKTRWAGRAGRIDKNLLEKYVKPDAVYYICGLEVMVKDMRALLAELGVDKKKIKFEKW